ncbi:molybdenum ABC transporter ATP-binding protein [Phaeobacter sp. B1627]|uniref:molybdenum ABC transporter ATP-binding protein n=1 Tax=Phaeobacter sp. B1627 TaxID=2583809 RepID=UPI001118627D|nr:molybdenum ABC transporter ATP-binding protein [Phaeobacter sp. B1627]TNJ45932.1 molybdenum ABC transporter ATP-binding protein [Phaeobacter sp. B1627]
MKIEIDLCLQQGRFTLDATFSVPSGLTVIFGRSGSGKTTLINAVAGLLKPDRGQIKVGETVLFDAASRISLPPRKRRLGYIFQDARLFPHLSVQRNLFYGRRLIPARGRTGDQDQVIEMLGLRSLLNQYPAHLSGGEKQRVAIGRALLASPDLILADEPLAALDLPRKLEILPYFERIRDEMGVPILYVTHSAAEVARLATTVVVLDGGRVTQVGPASEVLSDPNVVPTGVRSVGSVLQATLVSHHEDGLSELDAGGVALFVPRVDRPIGTRMRMRISAHEVILSNRMPEGLSALNVIPGTVGSIRAGEGPGALVTLQTQSGPIVARITQRSANLLGLAPGTQAFAIVKSVAIAPEDIGGGGSSAPTGIL